MNEVMYRVSRGNILCPVRLICLLVLLAESGGGVPLISAVDVPANITLRSGSATATHAAVVASVPSVSVDALPLYELVDLPHSGYGSGFLDARGDVAYFHQEKPGNNIVAPLRIRDASGSELTPVDPLTGRGLRQEDYGTRFVALLKDGSLMLFRTDRSWIGGYEVHCIEFEDDMWRTVSLVAVGLDFSPSAVSPSGNIVGLRSFSNSYAPTVLVEEALVPYDGFQVYPEGYLSSPLAFINDSYEIVSGGAVYWDGAGGHHVLNKSLSVGAGYFPEARGINDFGQVAGWVWSKTRTAEWGGTLTSAPIPVIWQDGMLSELERISFAQPQAINNLAECVGIASFETGIDPVRCSGGEYLRAVGAALWRGGKLLSLNSRIVNSDGWVMETAVAINDRGDILCWGYHQTVPPWDSWSRDATDPLYPHWFLLRPISVSLAVDGNRDGQITFDSGDQTTAKSPFRFWVNDDIDRRHTFYDADPDTFDDGLDDEEDDIGPDEATADGLIADCLDSVADSKRDLEDFARIHIEARGLRDRLESGELYIGLKWITLAGTPSIKVYRQYDATGGLGYLTSPSIGAEQLPESALVSARYPLAIPGGTAHTLVEPSETFILPRRYWLGASETTGTLPLLFEVCSPGKGHLKLVVLKQAGDTFTEIREGAGVWMDFRRIGDMYEQWTVGHGNGGPPNASAAPLAALTGSGAEFSYDANPQDPSPEERKYILYVHGWNVERWEKERFAETAYKRLWWQGYKGRFGVFTWPATYGFGGSQSHWAMARKLGSLATGIANGTHFDRGEWTAWRTGAPLRQLLIELNNDYSGELYVFSHSMGGIVVSEALRLQSQAGGGQIIKTYVPSQAALSAHTYDATLSEDAGSPNALQWTYNHPGVPDLPWPIGGSFDFGPQTPNVYGGWHASVLSGGGGGSKAVGQIKNFYNRNDWALSAPVWQYNQLTKPDWSDPDNDQPYKYAHQGGPDVALSDARFGRQLEPTDPDYLFLLDLGTPADVRDRYEILAFAAESRVKALGATDNVNLARITEAWNLQTIWGPDPRGQDHRTHRWHSGQFRNFIQYQRSYWKALLGNQGFGIPTTTLP